MAEDNTKQNIKQREIVEEMQQAYLEYAMSVIVARALPDVRDGLKPVHRRILYSMHEIGLRPGAKYQKSAKVVGSTMGSYHPHGDTAIYDSLVRMAQDFSLRYPLVDGQGNFGCFTGDTQVVLTDSRSISFKELVREHKNGKINYTYTFNHNTKSIEIGEIKNPRLTKKNSQLVEVILDNGEKIRCTPDHRFMLRDDSYRQAKDLIIGDSLMAGYFRLSIAKDDKNAVGYRMIWQLFEKTWSWVHRLADNFNIKNNIYTKNSGRIRHHTDFNKLNNNPDNIKRMDWKEHWRLHYEFTSTKHKTDPEYVRKLKEGRQKYWSDPRSKAKAAEFLSERNKKWWKDQNYRNERIKAIKELWDNKEYKEFMREASRKNLKNLWQKEEFKKLLSKLKSQELKNRWQDESYRQKMAEVTRVMSLKLWSDEKHREHISRIQKEHWLNPEYRERQTRVAKELWNDPAYRGKYSQEHFRNAALSLWNKPGIKELHREKAKKQWNNPGFRKVVSEATRERNLKRLESQPDFMRELTQKSAVSLRNKWKSPEYKDRVIKSKILGYANYLLTKYGEVTEATYEENRMNNGIPKLKNALMHFNNLETLSEQARLYNHKVKSVKFIEEREDVFDLTIDKTHNFLLAVGVFVHNSIDADAPAAMRYCVTGNTRVVTGKGLLKISNLVKDKSNEQPIDIKVLSLGKKINNAVRWFDSGIHKTKKIMTARGFSIEGTHNHPLLVWAENSETHAPYFKWKLMEDVKEGDFLVIDRSDTLWPKTKPLLKNYYPKNTSSRVEIKKLPKYLDEDLAHILGALISEGTIKKNEIEFCNSDYNWIVDFERRWSNVFPDCRLHKFKRQPNSYGKKPYWTLEIHSRFVIQFLKNLGLAPVRSAQKEIPEIVFGSSKTVAASFLRAYFEGDGSVSFSSKMNELSCCSISESLISQVQLLLLRFGILSTKRFDYYRTTYKLYIRDLTNYVLFQSNIGFISARKKDKLSQLMQRVSKNYSQTDSIPFLRDFVYSYLSPKYSEKVFALKHNFDRYPNLAVNYHDILTSVRADNREKVKNIFTHLLRLQYAYEPVVKTEDQEPQRVYSIKVDSGCHSFIGNGFINHNTECRMAPMAEELLSDIEKDTVNFQDNYDASVQEPKVLPSKVPNLLINGSMGIAVGMATNIPPHNLSEVLDALAYLADNSDAKIDDLMQFVKGPDFPTGGVIYNEADIHNAYATGRGPLVMRGKAEITEGKRGFQIIVNEIPYQVNKSELIKHIADLVKDKKLDGIKDIRDESDKDGLRIAIDLKPDAFPKKVLNNLFKHTELQKSFHFNMLALVDGIQPQILGLKGLLEKFIDHRKEVITRRAKYDLRKAKDRAHILEGLKMALDHIDEIIALIKKSDSREDAFNNLIKKFRFSDKQATAILEMKLQALAGLERKKINDELKEKKELIAYLEDLLASPNKILSVVKDEFKEIREKYHDERRTRVVKSPLKEIGEEELVPEENSLFMITRDGYIKRMAPDVLRSQKRGGKGLIGMATKEEDIVSHFFLANTHDSLLFFTSNGKVFQTKGYEVPESSRQSKGKAIVNFLQISPNETITAVVPIPKGQKRMYLFMATEHGIIKKVEMDAFDQVRHSGILAIKLKGDDRLGWVMGTSGDDQIIMTTSEGNAIRFKEKDVRPMGRAAAGVIGIRLEKDQRVVGADVVPSGVERGLRLLVVMQNGYGKRTDLKSYKVQKRGGRGIMTAKITSKTGKLVSAHITSEENKELIAVSRKGVVIRTSVESISVLGRATQGVRVMRVEVGDGLASVAVV